MRLRLAASLAGIAVLAGCVPRAAPPVPAPPRPIPVRPQPAPLPAPPPSSDWRDWALSPGTWRYARAAGGSSATFGRDARDWSLRLTCRANARQVLIERVGQGATTLTIRTSTVSRTLPAAAMSHADAQPPLTIVATLPASDPLFDAMGFSRGRFIVEGGAPGPLVVPAWPEVLRVVEDCRG